MNDFSERVGVMWQKSAEPGVGLSAFGSKVFAIDFVGFDV
jgi:hypothetical protein